MAPIANWPLRLWEELRGTIEPEAEWRSAVHRSAEGVSAEQASLRAGLVRSARQPLAGARHILTLSWSSTVLDLLLAAAPGATITVAEARPRCEGRVLAERLLGVGREVRVITDAQIASAAAGADLVLIGADTICRDLAVVNKSGSLPAALAARHAGKPFLIAADTYKVSPRVDGTTVPLESMEGAEVWPERPDICRNVYFEAVPGSLATGFITERGFLDGRGMVEVVAQWQARYAEAGL